MGAPSNHRVDLEPARASARQRLGDSYAHDRIDADELDRRLDALEHASCLDDIAALTGDLADPAAQAVTDQHGVSALVPVDQVSARSTIAAYFAETKRTGPWTPARDNDVRAIFASVRLDLREAQLAAGITHFAVEVALGELELIVPPGLPVDVECSAIFGEIDHDERIGDPVASPTAGARIRVTGRVWFGSVHIREQQVGESRGDARKRRKAERKRVAKGGGRPMLGSPREPQGKP